jgi:two-component system, LytTR family, response regulator
MKALIIDDERPARAEMKRLLKPHPEIEIVGEAASSSDALQMIAKLTPDLLFLDVQMHGDTGFDLLAQLPAPLPRVIFTTAYDEYAVRAFEVNALDYLLKPVEPARLTEALQRATKPVQAATAGGEHPEMDGETKFTESDRVFIREEDRCWFLPVREIRLLESEGNYTRVHFADKKPLIYRSLTALEERLPAALFFRANRSQIVNVTLIDTMENWFSGNLKARLRGGDEIEMSRRQAALFRERASL